MPKILPTREFPPIPLKPPPKLYPEEKCDSSDENKNEIVTVVGKSCNRTGINEKTREGVFAVIRAEVSEKWGRRNSDGHVSEGGKKNWESKIVSRYKKLGRKCTREFHKFVLIIFCFFFFFSKLVRGGKNGLIKRRKRKRFVVKLWSEKTCEFFIKNGISSHVRKQPNGNQQESNKQQQ